MRTYGYIRVSGKGQIEGDGPERQELKIRQFCLANGLEYVQSWSDLGVSGTCEFQDREQFSAMLAKAAADGVEAVVVERIDRLAREVLVGEFILREFQKRNLKIFAADQGLIDLVNSEGDPTRTLIRQILAALSQWERSMIVGKLAGARQRIRKEKGKCEGQKAYGERPGEDEILRSILDQTARGYAPFTIAQDLIIRGKRTRGGKEWSARHVRRILQNRGMDA